MADWIREMISDRLKVFKKEGRESVAWKTFKKKIVSIVETRKHKHYEHVVYKLDNDPNGHNFFRLVNSLLGHNETKRWNPLDMYPGKSKQYVVESLASFFNDISNSYLPLSMDEVPEAHNRDLPEITTEEIAKKMRS